MTLPAADLDLIDALVWCGAISRAAARDAAATAEPGRVATYIMSRGYSTLGPAYVIAERLAKAEAATARVRSCRTHYEYDAACAACTSYAAQWQAEQPETD